MPDWMSHILIGLIFAEAFNIRKKSLVLLGALMPDLISKLFLLFFYLGLPNNIGLGSFHTPIMCFLLSILIAPLFRYSRAKTILLVDIGLATHFLFDLAIRHFTSGMRLFFPFSMKVYRIDLMWPEQSIYLLIFSLIAYIFVKAAKRIYLEKIKI